MIFSSMVSFALFTGSIFLLILLFGLFAAYGGEKTCMMKQELLVLKRENSRLSDTVDELCRTGILSQNPKGLVLVESEASVAVVCVIQDTYTRKPRHVELLRYYFIPEEPEQRQATRDEAQGVLDALRGIKEAYIKRHIV